MQLNVKNNEAYRLARALADRYGESLTEAVTKALRQRLERPEPTPDRTPEEIEQRFQTLMRIAESFDSLPVYDDRSADEIIGYDENGLPS